ncbi:hypothetical protein [Methylocystis echinoides]|jgi:hypothetical protein|uniref:hypothetical protein n=1 Tax=Methylocystis echinoides TaxID=29468 RepID=UPI00342D82F4
MRKRLLASLIVCVALLTQLGASFAGAAAARDGFVFCHRQIVAAQASAPADVKGAPAQAPLGADHASCSLCQLGFSVISGEPPYFLAQALRFYLRVAFVERDAPAPRSAINLNAPARAPPSAV